MRETATLALVWTMPSLRSQPFCFQMTHGKGDRGARAPPPRPYMSLILTDIDHFEG